MTLSEGGLCMEWKDWREVWRRGGMREDWMILCGIEEPSIIGNERMYAGGALFVGRTHSFIHSGHLYSAHSSPLYTTHRRSRLQHGYCIGVSRRSAQATAGKGLAQGPYVA